MEAGSGGIITEAPSVLSGVVGSLSARDRALASKATPSGTHFVLSCGTGVPSLLLFFGSVCSYSTFAFLAQWALVMTLDRLILVISTLLIVKARQPLIPQCTDCDREILRMYDEHEF